MTEIFLSLIQQLNGAVFTLIAILILVFWGLFKMGGIITHFTTFKEENKDTKSDLKDIKTDIAKVKATTDLLYQAHLKTLEAHSPLDLSAIGKKVAQDISAKDKIGKHWTEIKTMLEQKNPKNPYDIQTVALEIAKDCFEKFLTPQEQDEIKTYAYKTGMNLLQIYPVIGIEIRNKILEERNIKIEDIDKHDPANKAV